MVGVLLSSIFLFTNAYHDGLLTHQLHQQTLCISDCSVLLQRSISHGHIAEQAMLVPADVQDRSAVQQHLQLQKVGDTRLTHVGLYVTNACCTA